MTPRYTIQDQHLRGLVFLCIGVLSYCGLWVVTRVAVQFLSPFWFAFARFGTAATVLFIYLAIANQLRIPPRRDLPVIFSVGGIMIGIYACLFQSGLQFVEAGRAAFLGYTVAVWSLPMSVILLGERPSRRRIVGFVIAIAGLIVLFNPGDFDWTDRNTVIGNGMLLLAALIWAPVVIHLRVNRSTLTTLQLVPWQLLVAALVVAVVGLVLEGPPELVWTTEALAAVAFCGFVGTALGMYAVNSTLRLLPTITSTIGLLGVPVLSLVVSMLFLGEELTLGLALGLTLILGGIGLVSVPERKSG